MLTPEVGTIFTTNAGAEVETQALACFFEMAKSEADRQQRGSQYEYLGEGSRGRVVVSEDNPELCVKTVGSWTGRYPHRAGHPVRPRNLVVELYFMDAFKEFIEERDAGFFVPQPLLAQRTVRDCYSMLQERLPKDATTLKGLSVKDRPLFQATARRINERFDATTKGSLIRAGVGDFIGDRNTIHIGNVLLGKDLDPEGPIYLIDLIGNRTLAAAAYVLACTQPQIMSTAPQLSPALQS